jgi:predicted small metal-binding protein
MKQFKCGDVVPGCQWVTRNDDEKELFEEIHTHARDVHGMDEVPPEVVDAIQRVITEV